MVGSIAGFFQCIPYRHALKHKNLNLFLILTKT